MSIRARKNVGVIGLGIIGRRVADNLRERGFHVFVWNRTPRAVPNFVGSPAEVAEICDFIQIFVSDGDALLQMVQKISRNLSPSHVVMAHCTVSPDTMRGAAEIVEKRGARFLDAPFTGSKMAAETGQLVYYVGGDEAALEQARPVLAASSKEIIHIGKVGDATLIKVATNMVTAASIQGAAEALALVVKSGLPAEKFDAAMRNNASNSGTMGMKLPMMIEGNFEPHFSVKHMLKDVVIATRLARSFGIELGATNASRDSLEGEMKRGCGDDDYSALVRQYFPAGGSLKAGAQDNSEAQPQFAGLDSETTSPPDAIAEPMPASPPTLATVEAEVVDPLPVETAAATEKVLQLPAIEPIPELEAVSESDAEPKVALESPETREQDAEVGGMWGNFWRRQAGG